MWYYADGDDKIGPIDDASFRLLLDRGEVGPQTLVWKEGMTVWEPYDTVRGTSADVEARCAQCGCLLDGGPQEKTGDAICAGCTEESLQGGNARAEVPPEMEIAAVWKRVAALALDLVVVYIGIAAIWWAGLWALRDPENPPITELGELLEVMPIMLSTAVWLILYTVLLVARFGATPGKMVLRLKIVRGDGSPVAPGIAFQRYAVCYVIFQVLAVFTSVPIALGLSCLSYVLAWADPKGRTLHDRLSDTRVVDARRG